MKAATRAAEPDHSVSLIPRRTTLGGRLVRRAALPLRTRCQVAIDDMQRDAERAGMALRVGCEAAEANLDAVIYEGEKTGREI